MWITHHHLTICESTAAPVVVVVAVVVSVGRLMRISHAWSETTTTTTGGKAMPGTYHFRMERGLQRGGRGRERVPTRRRQPFTCKSSTSFLHTLSARRPLHYPLIFCPGPSTSIYQSFFPLSFLHPFLAACTSSQREGQDLGARNNGTCKGAILMPYSRDGPRWLLLICFVFTVIRAQPANLHRVHLHRTWRFSAFAALSANYDCLKVTLINSTAVKRSIAADNGILLKFAERFSQASCR